MAEVQENVADKVEEKAVDDVTDELTIYLAGGCFWGMEDILRQIDGVVFTESGYTGGWLKDPKYEDTHNSYSGHAESVKVIYKPSVVSLQDLLETHYFRMHDPTTLNR